MSLIRKSWNRYAYVTNDPLSFVDPLGLDKSNTCLINNIPSYCPWGPSGGGGGGGSFPTYQATTFQWRSRTLGNQGEEPGGQERVKKFALGLGVPECCALVRIATFTLE